MMKQQQINSKVFILGMSVFFLIQFLLIGILQYATAYIHMWTGSKTIADSVYGALGIIVGGVHYLFINTMLKKYRYESITLFPNNLTQRNQLLLHGIVISVLIVLIIGIGMYFTSSIFHTRKTFYFLFNSPIAYCLYMLGTSILEELLFRGGILHLFIVMGRKKLGILISSAVFGSVHLMNLAYTHISFTEIIWLINISIAGIFFAHLYLRYGLLIVIFFHWYWNSSWLGETMKLVEQSYIFTIVMVSYLLFVYIHTWKKSQKTNSETSM